MRFVLHGAIVIFVGLTFGHRASAGCTSLEEAHEVLRAAERATRCNYEKLRDGAETPCALVESPACSGSLVEDTLALAYGENNPPDGSVDVTAMSEQLECQRLIGDASARFIGLELYHVIKGLSDVDAETRARRELDELPERCVVTVAEDPQSHIDLPSVGPQCAVAVGPVGSVVDAVALRDALSTLLTTWVSRVGPNPEPLKPNVILILTDDQRADTATQEFMPKLTKEITASAINFPNGFASNPVCCPSRSTILTGQYAHTHGVLTNNQGDPQHPSGGAWAFPDASTVATWLQGAGYRTALLGKYLNGYKEFSDDYAAAHGGLQYVPPGWTRWLAFREGKYFGANFADQNGAIVTTDPGTCLPEPPDEGECAPQQPSDCPYSTDYLRDQALDFIDESVRLGQRFFLYFSVKAPHAPACPAARHQGMFSDIARYRPPNFNEGAPGRDPDDDKPAWLRQQGPIHPKHLDAFRIQQLETLQAVDDAVEAIMQKLRDTGQDRTTMVVFYSDNGYLWGEHRRDKKSCPYEECIRVPFIVRYPPLAPFPRTDPGIVGNIDLAPTFAELAGVSPIPIAVDGRSMVRLLDGTLSMWRPDILAEHWGGRPAPDNPTPGIPTFAVVRGPVWKYTEYCTGERELYNLSTDPYELTNTVGNQPAVAASLATRLREIDPVWPDTIPFKCALVEDTADQD